METRSVPFWISAFIHFAVIGVAGILFIKPAEFAISTGHDSVEVSLVAAAADPTPVPPPVAPPEEQAVTAPPKPDDVVVPVSQPPPPVVPPPTPVEKVAVTPPVVVPPKPHHKSTVAKGDSSSPKPGKDAITASSDGGAIMDAKPDYLSNPPPVYPDISRQEKQEGVVVLSVIVGTEGQPDTVSVRNSSGFAPLDQSAVEAVQKWRFKPAMLGAIKMKSRVVIPVRFRLDN